MMHQLVLQHEVLEAEDEAVADEWPNDLFHKEEILHMVQLFDLEDYSFFSTCIY